ncbi:uncharacterized protein LOC129279902 isoform X2 [Lytechinus pictus]|uniref:uncharacterized protein LOC129279902 isoform X2 n=1 Tax=Lytechinus pictus TaxID=7653 RepID=UPI0030B9C440
MRHGYGIRNSVPYGMASIVRPSLRTSLTSLRSEHENGSIASSPENFGQRGGFAMDVSDDCTSDLESNKSATLKRNETSRRSRTLMGGFRSKRRKDRNRDSLVESGGSVASLRHNLKHQDSLKSNESTMSTSSVQSSCFESDMGHMHEEEASHDVTEVYMGEWKQDKRAGYGTSQRSDGYHYAGEWHNNKRHGYGSLTYPNGQKEEGKWKQNMLVASGKKKLFVIGSKKISDRVGHAVDLAGQAANLARAKADLAISRAAYAKEKAEMSDVEASEAREESIKARARAKDLASTLPPRASDGMATRKMGVRIQVPGGGVGVGGDSGGGGGDGGGAGEGGDIKLDRKKSFFGRHLGGFDRKNRMRGTIVKSRSGSRSERGEGSHPSSQSSDRSIPSGLSNEWDGRGASPQSDSQMREARSTGNLCDGSPVPRRHLRTLDRMGNSQQSNPSDSSPQMDRRMLTMREYHQREYHSMDERYGPDGREYHMDRNRHYSDRSLADLTPDSGISTTSDSDRLRREAMRSNQRKGPPRRQLTRQEGLDDAYHSSHGNNRDRYDAHYNDYGDEYYEDESIYDKEEEDPYLDDRMVDDDDQEKLKQQQLKQKKKIKITELATKVDAAPPGHYRTFQGRFPATCGIKYQPKPEGEEDDVRDPELDGEGALVVHSAKMNWAASKGLTVLVLVLNVGFTVLFTSLFLQMEEEGNWDSWP